MLSRALCFHHHNNLTPASLTESTTALTFPWYFCSLFMWMDTAGIYLSSRRSPNNFPIFAAAETSPVDYMCDLSSFSRELAEHGTVVVGVWITWAVTNLFEKSILKRLGLRKPTILAALSGGGITIVAGFSVAR